MRKRKERVPKGIPKRKLKAQSRSGRSFSGISTYSLFNMLLFCKTGRKIYIQPSAAYGVINRHHLLGAKEIANSMEIISIIILKWHFAEKNQEVVKFQCLLILIHCNNHKSLLVLGVDAPERNLWTGSVPGSYFWEAR